MKQFFVLLLILFPLITKAEGPIEINGIYYNFNQYKEASVTWNPNKYVGMVVIPSKVSYNEVEYKVTEIGNSAFSKCKDLTYVSIPNSVTRISFDAFQNCIVNFTCKVPRL